MNVRQSAPNLVSAHELNAMDRRLMPIVLVVDDVAFERKLIEKIMESTFYDVIFASGGRQALSILRSARPDLILMDMDMPEMTGLETLRILKAQPEFTNTPVMMVTSHHERDVVVECLKAGAVDFAIKPLDREGFLVKVAKLLAGCGTRT